MTKAYGCQSMTATLRRVMVRKPARAEHADEWKAFGYLHAVDQAAVEREHDAFCQILTDAGAEVIAAGPDEAGHLDAIFAYDPSLMTDHGAILFNVGKQLRKDETAFHAKTYGELGIPVLGVVEDPGTLEGGDTLWLDDKTLAIGRGYRSNEAGIQQMREILGTIGVEVLAYDLPYYHGPDECLHLMSNISPVAADLAVVYLPMMATAFVQELQGRGIRFVEVPDEEYDTMACNVLALEPGKALMIEGNPITKQRLEAAGVEVLTYEGTHISMNRQGGPTCLTRPILRRN